MVDFRNYIIDGVKLYKSDFNLNWLKKYLTSEPNIIIEFGSYDGGDSVYYKQNYPNSRVISLEASKIRYELIKPLENKFNIEVFNYAVCEYDGVIDFFQVIDPNVLDTETKIGSSGSINKRTDKYKQTFKHLIEINAVTVPCTRLDTFCQNQKINEIDFLHVDVEGAEHRVLIGLGQLRPKLIWAETYLGKDYYGNEAYDVIELKNQFNDMGYVAVEFKGSDTLYMYHP